MTVRFIVRCFAIAALLLSSASCKRPEQTRPVRARARCSANIATAVSAMEDAVQNLMNADKANLAAIIAFAKTANEDQRKAIGKALANVAKAYAAGGDPGSANSIQQAVVTAGLPELAKAYADAGGDTGHGIDRRWRRWRRRDPSGPPTGGPNTGTNVGGSNFAANQASSLTGNNSGGGGFTPVTPF